MTAAPDASRPDFDWKSAPIRPKRAMVLAAGLGKRMRPVTVTTPKALVEVGGRALIDRALDRLERAGVERAVVNVHYLAELVRVHVGRRGAPEIVISDETRPPARYRRRHRQGAARISATSRSTCSTPIPSGSKAPAPTSNGWPTPGATTSMDALLMLASTVRAVGYTGRGDFQMDPAGRLIRRPEREVAPFAYAGAAILHPRLFAGRTAEPFSLNELFDQALEAGRLFGMRMDGLWLHVGTPEAIGEAEHSIADSAA